MSLQQKGPRYNLHTKPKTWIENLALEAKTDISPPTPDHKIYRKLMAERISTLQKNNPYTHTYTHTNTHTEARIIKNIKLKENEAVITCADKGKTFVILPTKQYKSKITDFIRANHFHTTTKHSTKSSLSQIRRVINDSRTFILHETMETHKHDPLSFFHQRISQATQTRTSHPPHRQMARSPSLQTNHTIHPENKTTSSTTQKVQPRECY
jgi:hypothetical protein